MTPDKPQPTFHPFKTPDFVKKQPPPKEGTVVVCLDTSGSMAEAFLRDKTVRKIDIATQAIKSYVEPFLLGANLGIVYFGGEQAEWLFRPVMKLPGDLPQKASGSTPLFGALQLAWGALHKVPRRIILITDGVPTDATQEEIISEARSRSVEIMAIGIPGAEYDSGFLKQLAEATGGQFAEAGDPLSLSKALKAATPTERAMLGSGKPPIILQGKLP